MSSIYWGMPPVCLPAFTLQSHLVSLQKSLHDLCGSGKEKREYLALAMVAGIVYATMAGMAIPRQSFP
jgi:hypothetical protein